MTYPGGPDKNDPYDPNRIPMPPTYGEIPSLPRDGYGVSESGQPTYSAPTEPYPGYQQPGAYGTSPNQGAQNPYAAPTPYGAPAPTPYGAPAPTPYGAPAPYPAASPYGYPSPYMQSRGTNGLAIASLIVSIVGGCFYGIGSIVGVILGFVALNQIKQTGQEGKGLAVAGVAIGVAFVLGWVIFIAAMIIAAAAGA